MPTNSNHLMDDETWLNAGKALQLGFIDGILYSKEDDEDDDEDVEITEEESNKPEEKQDESDEDDDDEKKNLKASSFSFSEKKSCASLLSRMAKANSHTNPVGGVPADQLMKRLNLLSH